MREIGVAEPDLYRTHDLLQLAGEALLLWYLCERQRVCATGSPLWEILAAGEWKSPAFMSYIDLHKLDAELVLHAHVDEESDDDIV